MSIPFETLPQWIGWGVRIEAGSALLEAEVTRPAGARALVVFAQGREEGGISRPLNRRVADILHGDRFATLLFNAMGDQAREPQHYRETDMTFLERDLLCVVDWARHAREVQDLPMALLCTGEGAAAALHLVAEMGPDIRATVCAGGALGGALAELPRVQCPTLLVVAGQDPDGLLANRAAYRQLRCEKALCVVPSARGLFDEPEAAEETGELASSWIRQHFDLEE